MDEMAKALSLKRKRAYGDEKCFLEFRDEKVNLYINKEKNEFNNLHEMYEFLIIKHKSFLIYTNDFNLIFNFYYQFISNWEEKKISVVRVGARIYGLDLFNFISYRDMKYKFGSNNFTCAAALEIIDKEDGNRNASFTSNLGRLIEIDAVKQKFNPIPKSLRQIMMDETPKGAIILSRPNVEFTNVHCYDVCSAYIACLLEGNMPSKFIKTTNRIKGKQYFGKIKITNLKAKDPRMLTLYITKKQEGKDIAIVGSRVIAAAQYSFYLFFDEISIINQFYTYDKIEIDYSNLYEIKFEKLPLKTINAIRRLYDNKLAAKGQLDYDAFKQIVNRIYGFFITKRKLKDGTYDARDFTVPYQFGVWIISRQRLFMCCLINAVGLSHVVSAHTDGVKFDCDADEIVDKINMRRGLIYKDVGQWKKEGVLEKCLYFSNTVAKYLENGELKMKHGGITQEDVDNFLSGKTYKDVNEFSEFYLTIEQRLCCEEDRTYIERRKSLSSILCIGEGEE